MEIREATVEDAAAIAAVYVEARRVGYQAFFPVEYLDTLSVEDWTVEWRKRLAGTDGTTTIAAIDGGRVAGQVRFGPTTSPDLASAGEVFQLHVAPRYWGRSVGRRLLTAAAEAMTASGCERAFLWVYTANQRARRFYEREGWGWDGSQLAADFGSFKVDQLRYGRALTRAENKKT